MSYRDHTCIKMRRIRSGGEGCSFCSRPLLKRSRTGYVYDEVYEVRASYLNVRFCDDCFAEIIRLAAIVKLEGKVR